jgi:hypothetical protein
MSQPAIALHVRFKSPRSLDEVVGCPERQNASGGRELIRKHRG